ncbi:nucleotide exchange factor GrpE [Paraferrimonas sp. SM1919]|uniref:nucleotide exchange factor GrpE n=1 Tax=Paraferrimonas sp. SM1919 TaxID=2662263 RepID=UPI0013D13A10|nr:nucleotide exchange factor GrpE [Paraferrimonas sp. SM1919]
MSAEEQKQPEEQVEQAQTENQEVEQEQSIEVEVSELDQVKAELEEAKATIADQKDSVLRAAAEIDNVKRRAAIDVEKAHKFALEKFANELLPVIDNLERALSQEVGESAKGMVEGVELTLKTFLTSVDKFGLKQIDPKGEQFDPNFHQAISMVPNPEVDDNSVMDVMQKGFELNGRVLRPAMVVVAQGGPKPSPQSVDVQA